MFGATEDLEIVPWLWGTIVSETEIIMKEVFTVKVLTYWYSVGCRQWWPKIVPLIPFPFFLPSFTATKFPPPLLQSIHHIQCLPSPEALPWIEEPEHRPLQFRIETWLTANPTPYPTYSLWIRLHKIVLKPQNKCCYIYVKPLEEQFWGDRTKSSENISNTLWTPLMCQAPFWMLYIH